MHSLQTTRDSSLHAPPSAAADQPAPPAVILAAGEGSRLARQGDGSPKPALNLLGLSLAERTIVSCMAAGIQRFLVVLGHAADQVRTHYQGIAARRQCHVEFVTAVDWKLGNGASALAAADALAEGPTAGGDSTFLLIMSDHLIEPSLVEHVLRTRLDNAGICLAVDRDKAGVFDHEDVTKVVLSDDRVTRLNKSLEQWDAADTGVFLCTPKLFEGLRRAAARHKHSLTDGVNELASDGLVVAVDITGAEWLDVDTPESYGEARRRLLRLLRKGKGGEDGYVSTYFNRRISTWISAKLAATPITPNQITVISFLISLVGASLLVRSSYAAWVIGALFVQFSSIIDGCDGEIARLKHLASDRGAWLDTILDRYSDMAVALAVTFSYASLHAGPWPWVGGFLSVCGFILASYVTKEFTLRHGRPYPNDFPSRLKRRDLRLFIICVGAVLNLPYSGLLVAGVLSHICVGAILVKGWIRSSTHPRSGT